MIEQSATLNEFMENWDFFANAALSGALAGALLGALGIYILLKRMVFLSAALAQVSSAGIATAFLLQSLFLHVESHSTGEHDHLSRPWDFVFDPIFVASIFALIVLVVLGSRRKQHSNDAAIAFIYLAGASATLLIGTRITTEIQDIQQILIGNAVLVDDADFKTLIILTMSLLLLHIYMRRGFEMSAFFPESAYIAKLPSKSLNLLLLITLALAIATTTRILGALPVFAFSCLPAMAARQISPNLRTMLILSALIGATSGFLGYIVAFLYAFPVGPSQAAVAALSAALFWLIKIGVKSLLRLRKTPAVEA